MKKLVSVLSAALLESGLGLQNFGWSPGTMVAGQKSNVGLCRKLGCNGSR